VAKSSRTRVSRAEQMARFLETAQALGCDPSEELFGEIVRAIASARPGPPPTVNAPEPTQRARRTVADGPRGGKGAQVTEGNAAATNSAGRKGATPRTANSTAAEGAKTKAHHTRRSSGRSGHATQEGPGGKKSEDGREAAEPGKGSARSGTVAKD
jgi:hypothetical protein